MRKLVILVAILALQMPQTLNKKSIEGRSPASNVFAGTQKSYGNWTPNTYLDLGWHGYHVTAKVTKMRSYTSYKEDYISTCTSVGTDGKTKTKTCTKTNTHYIPLCPDGDCKFKKDITISRLGDTTILGKRTQPRQVLGKVISFDNGSVEKMELLNPSNVAIVVTNESEAQSKMRFDESQVTTFTGFDKSGLVAKERGHIEEMDAPGSITQPEIIYERVDGEDQFRTSVVERIGRENEGKETFRLSTLWCQTDSMIANRNSFIRLFKNDSFDMDSCGRENMPIISDAKNGIMGSLDQVFTSRPDSAVSIQRPGTRNHELTYDVVSDSSIVFGNGTSYIVEKNIKGKDTQIIHISSEKFQSMENCPKRNYQGKCNSPKAKLVALNANLDPEFEGIPYESGWIGFSEEQWNKPQEKAVALMAHEKTGEVYTRMDGTSCSDKMLRNSYSKRNMIDCKSATTYVLHFYVLFPNQINLAKTNFQKVDLLDKVMATMPEQAQSSKEIHAGEEFLDYIKALEIYHATGNPENIPFDLMVDMNTEEDSLTAQNKIWDLFSDMGVVSKRAGKVEVKLPTVQEQVETQEDFDEEFED